MRLFYNNKIYSSTNTNFTFLAKAPIQNSSPNKNSSSKDGDSYFGNTDKTKSNTTINTGSPRPKTPQKPPASWCKKSPCTGSVLVKTIGFGSDIGEECFGDSGDFVRFITSGLIGFENKTQTDILLKTTVYNYDMGYGFFSYHDIYKCSSSYRTIVNESVLCYDWIPLVPGMVRKIESHCELATINIQSLVVDDFAPNDAGKNLTKFIQSTLKNPINFMTIRNNNSLTGSTTLTTHIEDYGGSISLEIGVVQDLNALSINLTISAPNYVNGTQLIYGASSVVSSNNGGAITNTTVNGSFTSFGGWGVGLINSTNNSFVFKRES